MVLLPQWVRRAMFAPATNEDVIALVQITNEDIDAVIRTSSFPSEIFSTAPLLQGTVHGGEQYYFGLLSYERPDDIQDDLPNGSAVIENITQNVGWLAGPDAQNCTVVMKHVVKSAPDVVIIEFPDLIITGATAAMEMVSLALGLTPDESEPIPFEIISPQTCPGMFR